ncbi:hypothetical protein EB796_005929 [Bugula neritina]|uniref:Uncharacterized protein n=1 Tax=Bugula neritina TaxID=10212 RepID=A0A7J7KC12_BUGNE|nr:hypothetical protein EB796_005929 [Bugula neritina]
MYSDVHSYSIPIGITEAYFNFSSLTQDRVSRAVYQRQPTVRVAAVSNKYRVLTVVLLDKRNQTTFSVNMTFGEGQHSHHSEADKKAVPVTEEPPFIFSDLPSTSESPSSS